MKLKITFIQHGFSPSARLREIEGFIKQSDDPDVTWLPFSEDHPGSVVLIDAPADELRKMIRPELRKGRFWVWLVSAESPDAAELLDTGVVDDIIVFPLRSLELRSKLKYYRQVLLWAEVEKLNSSFSDVVTRFKEDLELAESLQKKRIPKRFGDLSGIRVYNRYFAGVSAGSEYFDVVESSDKKQFLFLLSDSSSYGLSSALLKAMMRVGAKLGVERANSCIEVVKPVFDELMGALKTKDELSLFCGLLFKRDLRFCFVHFGRSVAMVQTRGGAFTLLKSQGGVATNGTGLPVSRDQMIDLTPGDRLVFSSDGFVNLSGGEKAFSELLNQAAQKDSKELLNEVVFRAKKKFLPVEKMPPYDCSLLVVEVPEKMIVDMTHRIKPEPVETSTSEDS